VSDPETAMEFMVAPDYAGERLDKYLGTQCSDLSRARLQGLVKEGAVFVNGKACTQNSYKVEEGDQIALEAPALKEPEPEPEDIPLDIFYEDEALLVINKPAGLVVHPGAGNITGTLVNALLYHCGDSLSGIGGVIRPGIVHRLDKETSGLLVVAKNDKAHRGLSRQIEGRSLKRIYHAIALGVPFPPKHVVDMPIGRHAHQRTKMAVNPRQGRAARTYYEVLENFEDNFSLVELRLETGRTHQIRLHMQALKHPLIGDPLYGPQLTALRAALKAGGYDAARAEVIQSFGRQALHAHQIAFTHPITGEDMAFESPYPDDFKDLLSSLRY